MKQQIFYSTMVDLIFYAVGIFFIVAFAFVVWLAVNQTRKPAKRVGKNNLASGPREQSELIGRVKK